MEESTAATWLNNTFETLDYAGLELMHGLAASGGEFFTPLFSFISLIGEQGILMFLMAFVLMLFKRTRKIGFCVFVAVCIGALITNIALKDLVARPRPFEELSLYHSWWQLVGSPEESGYSFPSGHVTAAMAGVTALIIAIRKPIALTALLYVLLMAASRIYLIVHYPTDVIAAVLIGAIAAVLSVLIVEQAIRLAEVNQIAWITRLFPEKDALRTHGA